VEEGDLGGRLVICVSHLLQLRMLLTRSATGSEIHCHLLGHHLPQKVRRNTMRRKRRPLITTCVGYLTVMEDIGEKPRMIQALTRLQNKLQTTIAKIINTPTQQLTSTMVSHYTYNQPSSQHLPHPNEQAVA